PSSPSAAASWPTPTPAASTRRRCTRRPGCCGPSANGRREPAGATATEPHQPAHAGVTPMILEGLVTTRNPDGSPHLAPMGPRVGADFARFVLRPFPTSTTYRNLLAHPEGVLHVTDDALLLAKAALGAADLLPPLR